MSLIQILAYSFALWLGLYLIARDLRKPVLRYAGAGLVAYALGSAAQLMAGVASEPAQAEMVLRLGWPFFFLPGLFWSGATVTLLPEGGNSRLARVWGYAISVLAVGFYLLAIQPGVLFTVTPDGNLRASLPLLTYTIVALPMAAAFAFVVRAQVIYRRLSWAVMLVAALFFALSLGFILFPLTPFSPRLLALATGVDLLLLGLTIGALDAFEEGQALWRDMLRSLLAAVVVVLVFGGQVALAMSFSAGVTFSMLALLLAIIAAALLTQTFAAPVQGVLDRLAFPGHAHIRAERADLRAASGAQARVRHIDFAELDDDEFTRLTRRALSHLGNLPRLAASPLTRFPLVEKRLADRQASANTLERAAELKALLTESIERLKPRDKGAFGTSDEWRFYNALYFPYVAGLKVSSRRATYDKLDPVFAEALDWFRAYVPERTLFNWQNAAAELVARDLREQQSTSDG